MVQACQVSAQLVCGCCCCQGLAVIVTIPFDTFTIIDVRFSSTNGFFFLYFRDTVSSTPTNNNACKSIGRVPR
jgi:hypothetical protein